MNKLILFLLLIPIQLFSQQEEDWIKLLESPENSRQILKTENVIEKYSDFDFAPILMPETNFLGFIGSKYKRIKIEFLKTSKYNDFYKVIGYSIVGSNKCDFEGEIRLKQIREFRSYNYGVDAMYRDSGIVAQGILIGEYNFKENPNQNHVGVFKGIMSVWWYLDSNNKIHYDKIEKHSDSYKNSQYIGIWTEYNKSNSKICNWGEYRIPFSGDLDIGAGEFSVNPKYKKNGWEDFSKY